ncbi:MAG TPA: alpha/beta hydrolase [Nocardioides sp.]|nr:alpha/beta hydrolase [Nocardioides sp.]
MNLQLPGAVEAATLRALMSLPEPVQRALGGRPIVRDGQTLEADVQLMLRLQRIARPRDEQLPVEVVRRNLLRETALVAGDQRIGAVRDLQVAGRPARHYLPSHPVTGPDQPGPVLVFFHGGGFLEGNLESHDAPCRVLAERSGVPVLATTYGLAPESQFPTAHEHAYENLRWVIDHAAELDIDPARVAVGGDSAGGNLAGWCAIASARDGIPLAWQMLVYPVTDPLRDGASVDLFAEGFYLTREFMDRADESYLGNPAADRVDPRIRLIDADLPRSLAPAHIVTAGFDPLRDEGEAYARRLAAEGFQVELERRAGYVHGFFNIVGVGRSGRLAVDNLADRLRTALA